VLEEVKKGLHCVWSSLHGDHLDAD